MGERLMSGDAKLSRFISAVNEDIDSKVSVIISGAETERDAILKDAQKQAEEQAQKLYENNMKRITQKMTRQVSQSEFTAKKELLKHREELTEKLFSEVLEKLADIRKGKDYADILQKKLAVTNIEDGTEIALSPGDYSLADTLKRAVKAENVTFVQDDSIMYGGFSVFNTKNGTIIDKTFDGAVEEQRVLFTNRNIFA
jgi:vacuolar-type H+-ATPase subunit E/Vma4